MRRALTTIAAASLLAGCMNLAPRHERPALPVAPTYPAELLPAGGAAGPAAADIAWQRFFADARLRRLIELSLASNRDLRVAVLAIERARAQVRIVRADALPSVGAGVTAQRQASGGDVATVYAAGLQFTSYELDFFGRVRNLGDAALGRFLATEEGRQTTQIALVAGVANAYIALLADDELLRVTRETLGSREESLRLTRLRFDNGVSSEVDVRQAEQLLETARATLAQTQRQRALDENALTLLVGQPLPADLPAPQALGEQTGAAADLPPGLPSDLLERRPDIRAAEQTLRAAAADVGAARAALFPRIAHTASAGSASTALSGLFAGGSWALTGSASLLQTIFDSGRNQAGVDVARVDRAIAVADYEKAVQTAFREVADALAGRATLGEELRAQTAVATAAQASLNLADLRYRNGVASYFDLLDAQRTLFAARQAAVQTRAAQAQNAVTLYKVLGGGWATVPAP
jgi:multidrug efflux system outer membrane protein